MHERKEIRTQQPLYNNTAGIHTENTVIAYPIKEMSGFKRKWPFMVTD